MEIRRYTKSNGKAPFDDWLKNLRDNKTRLRIQQRLRRISLGNLGDYKSIKEGVCELRLDFGSGYRIYFSQIDQMVILLLCAGDKDSQNRDIEKAVEYLKDYENRTNFAE